MTIRRDHLFDGVNHRERITADVEHIVENNKVHKRAGNNGFSKERTFRKIGSIPLVLYNEAFRQGINPMDGSPEAEKWVRKMLEENPAFRTVDNINSNAGKRHIIK